MDQFAESSLNHATAHLPDEQERGVPVTVSEWLEQLVAALPDDSSTVTLSRAALRAKLAGAPSPALGDRHLTVEEVAELMQRSPSTVRGWLIDGTLKGYKLNRRDWRVRPEDVEAYQSAQAAPPERGVDEGPADITEWRRMGR